MSVQRENRTLSHERKTGACLDEMLQDDNFDLIYSDSGVMHEAMQ